LSAAMAGQTSITAQMMPAIGLCDPAFESKWNIGVPPLRADWRRHSK
jgi:hypothetical protein